VFIRDCNLPHSMSSKHIHSCPSNPNDWSLISVLNPI
jgi:hypothetical protein